MSLYLSQYVFNRDDASELNKLVDSVPIPDGIEILGNYTIIDTEKAFTILRADSHRAILEYTSQFRERIPNFEIVPIEPISEGAYIRS